LIGKNEEENPKKNLKIGFSAWILLQTVLEHVYSS